jgi:fatty-acyl-CoA synthase
MTVRKIDCAPPAYDYPLLIKRLLLDTPSLLSPHQEIVYRNRSRYDYVTLKKRMSQLANALGNLGVKQGDMVAVMDWDSHRYLESFFAIPMMGQCFIPLI